MNMLSNKKVFDNFVQYGREANIQADAAAKAGKEGEVINEGWELYKPR